MSRASVEQRLVARNPYSRLMRAIEADTSLRLRDEAVLRAMLRCPPVVVANMVMYPSMTTLAKKAKASINTVRRSVQRLCRDGWLDCVKPSKGGVNRHGDGIASKYQLGLRLRRVLLSEMNPPKLGEEITSISEQEQEQKHAARDESAVARRAIVQFPFKSHQLRPSTLKHALTSMWEQHHHEPYNELLDVGYDCDTDHAVAWLSGNDARTPSPSAIWHRCQLTHREIQTQFAAYLRSPMRKGRGIVAFACEFVREATA